MNIEESGAMSRIQSSCSDHIFRTYARLPVTFVKGKGSRLWDENGKEYLDFISGIAVCNLGHCHPEITKALCEQADTLVHVSNLFYTVPQVHLAEELTRLSFADKVFFCNSGAEANEAAIKLARKYSRDKYGEGRFHIITMRDCFHGRTMATLSATAQTKVQKGFEPLVEGFSYVDFNSMSAVESAVTEKTCAVMLEPIQGEGGVNIPSPGYLAELKAFCGERDLLLIFDEVQVGMGRTGRLFAHEHESVTPDIMTLAKALANGLPMGAMLAVDRVAEAFGPGAHATTFGGTPLVASAALRVLQIISGPDFLATVRDTAAYLLGRLEALKERYPIIKEIRARGLMIGVELVKPGQVFVEKLLEMGFVINCTHDTVLRLVPPLTVSREEIDRLITALEGLFMQEAL